MLVPDRDADLLNKGFLCLQNFMNYMNLILANPKLPEMQRRKLNIYQGKANWVMTDFTLTIDQQSAEAFKKEVSNWEALSFENLFTEASLLPVKDRQALEMIAVAMRKGEFKIEYSEDEQ